MAAKKWSTTKKVVVFGGGGILLAYSLLGWAWSGENPIEQVTGEIKRLFGKKDPNEGKPISIATTPVTAPINVGSFNINPGDIRYGTSPTAVNVVDFSRRPTY
jgi:hypothetical protein